MADPLLEVYEDIAEGRTRRAARKLARLRADGIEPDRVAELQAFLDADEATEERASAGAPTDITHPGVGLGRPPERDAVPFRCLACAHDQHVVRPVILNRRLTTFFGFDMVDRSAVTYACARCGHIAWFGRGAPGFIQAWLADDADRLREPGSGDGMCRLCGFRGLQPSRALLNTALLSFMGLDWLDEGAMVERCRRCGLLHWSGTQEAPPSPWRAGRPQTDPRVACPACDGRQRHAYQALQNTRAATALGLDWLDRPAWVLRCADCHAMTWWTRRPQEVTE